MKKSVKIRVLCLIIAFVVLSGAVAFAAYTGSPYETLKKAVLDAITYRNVTVESLATLTVNGMILEESRSYYISGDKSYLSYDVVKTGDTDNFYYSANGLSIGIGYKAEDGALWYYANISPNNDYSSWRTGEYAILSPESRESAKVRFFELLIDAIVGDLKNNVTMNSGDGVRIIRGTLTESQVPELVKAGLDVIVEQSRGYSYNSTRDISFDGKVRVFEEIYKDRDMKTVTTWKQAVRQMTPEEEELWESGTYYHNNGIIWGFSYIDGIRYVNEGSQEFVSEYTEPLTRADYEGYDPIEIPMKSLAINYIHGEAMIDSGGNLLRIDVSGTASVTNIFGDISAVEAQLTADFSDIGTSNPVCPIPGAEELFTTDYAKTRFGNEYIGVYFRLNEDGSINEGSVTTTYPGETNSSVFRKDTYSDELYVLASDTVGIEASPYQG